MVVRQNACRLSAECNHKILKSFVEFIEVLRDYYLASSIRFLHPYDVYQVVEKNKHSGFLVVCCRDMHISQLLLQGLIQARRFLVVLSNCRIGEIQFSPSPNLLLIVQKFVGHSRKYAYTMYFYGDQHPQIFLVFSSSRII